MPAKGEVSRGTERMVRSGNMEGPGDLTRASAVEWRRQKPGQGGRGKEGASWGGDSSSRYRR